MQKRVRVLFVAGVLLAACGLSPEPAPDSGIEGKVLIGPACPGPVSATSPCPDRPVSVGVKVTNTGSGAVSGFKSGPDGGFHVNLPPGNYRLLPDKPPFSPAVSAKPVDVTVVAHAFTPVNVYLDSGVR